MHASSLLELRVPLLTRGIKKNLIQSSHPDDAVEQHPCLFGPSSPRFVSACMTAQPPNTVNQGY